MGLTGGRLTGFKYLKGEMSGQRKTNSESGVAATPDEARALNWVYRKEAEG